MPSLGQEWIKTLPERGNSEPFAFKSEVSVDRDGMFSFTFPPELLISAQQMCRNQPTPRKFFIDKPRVNDRLCGKNKDECKWFLQQIVADYLKCSVTRETVILYQTSAQLSYWQTADGIIFPNGSYDPEYSAQSGQWGGETHATKTSETFSLGIAARVYEKSTAHRESGDHVTYAITYGDGDHFSRDTWLQKLNSFVGLYFESHHLGAMRQMPYTEDAARFFYQSMIGLCQLSSRIEAFFKSPDALRQAIEGGFGHLLTAPATNSEEEDAKRMS